MNRQGGLIFFSIIILLVLVGCNSAESDKKVTAVAGVSVKAIDASSDNYKVVKLNGDKNLQLKLGSEEKDVYLLLSNPSDNKRIATISHTQKSSLKVKSKVQNRVANQVHLLHAPMNIQEFNSQLFNSNKSDDSSLKKLLKTTIDDKEGNSKEFYMDAKSTELGVQATARKVIKSVGTQFGKKDLTIWVENSTWGSGCAKANCITQTMVDTLADNFLKEGLDNDIYDGVSNIFGEEWGIPSSSVLIEESNHISILLTDIQQDNKPNGGVIGYFYSKDNYKKGSCSNNQCDGSNERIMFYIDSVMYANGGDNWNKNSFWSQQVFSTLAHEFQHMIYFYQKNVKQEETGTATWINEMLSESTEDLMAVKMNVDGPRNVIASRGDAGEGGNQNGRYPLFNKNNSMRFISWDNQLEDYSKVSSFGAYLMRNYGGAQLLHDIVSSQLVNEAAIVEAVHKHINGKSKTFNDLLHEWGVAILLSKSIDVSRDSSYLYNAGDFIASEYNGINYSLGSINFFNYNPAPSFSEGVGEVDAQSNSYYKVGENLTGEITVNVSNTAGLDVSMVIVK